MDKNMPSSKQRLDDIIGNPKIEKVCQYSWRPRQTNTINSEGQSIFQKGLTQKY